MGLERTLAKASRAARWPGGNHEEGLQWCWERDLAGAEGLAGWGSAGGGSGRRARGRPGRVMLPAVVSMLGGREARLRVAPFLMLQALVNFAEFW